MIDLLGALVQMGRGLVAGGEVPGRLDHHVDAEVAPRQLRRVRLDEDLQLLAVDVDAAVLAQLDRARVGTEDRVVLEQVGQRAPSRSGR